MHKYRYFTVFLVAVFLCACGDGAYKAKQIYPLPTSTQFEEVQKAHVLPERVLEELGAEVSRILELEDVDRLCSPTVRNSELLPSDRRIVPWQEGKIQADVLDMLRFDLLPMSNMNKMAIVLLEADYVYAGTYYYMDDQGEFTNSSTVEGMRAIVDVCIINWPLVTSTRCRMIIDPPNKIRLPALFYYPEWKSHVADWINSGASCSTGEVRIQLPDEVNFQTETEVHVTEEAAE